MNERIRVSIAAAVLLTAAGCSYDSAESVAEGAVERTVAVGRGLGAGIVEGARSGREGTPSADGATVVADWDRLAERGGAEISEVIAEGDATIVTLLFANDGEEPLRVAGLARRGALLAVDADRVAHDSTDAPTDFTVHPDSRTRVQVRFSLPTDQVQSIRLWGHGIDVPPDHGATSRRADTPSDSPG